MRCRGAFFVGVLSTLAAGCAKKSVGASSPTAGSARGGVASLASKAPRAAATGIVADASTDPSCRAPRCATFGDAKPAFARVLAEDPVVLAIGEAHALRGTERVESSTRRFTRDLLPMLRGRASDLVVELLLPNPACAPATEGAAKAQRVVTDHQAKTDQNDYVALGNAARALGIRPHALEPTCDDLRRIAGGGDDAIVASLDVVTRLARESLERYAAANRAAHDPRMVVGYGGAMHNDLAPRLGFEKFTFGPVLERGTAGRYVELDLIVSEFVDKTPSWQALPWFAEFAPDAHPGRATLFMPSVHSYALIFPRGPAPTATPRDPDAGQP
jgi:hypothetical protein